MSALNFIGQIVGLTTDDLSQTFGILNKRIARAAGTRSRAVWRAGAVRRGAPYGRVRPRLPGPRPAADVAARRRRIGVRGRANGADMILEFKASLYASQERVSLVQIGDLADPRTRAMLQ